MKVSAWFIVCISLSVQLLIANTGRGQDSADRKITLELHDQSLRSALNTIGRLSGLRVAYPLDQVDQYKHINLPRESRSVNDILAIILNNTGLTFRQQANFILVFKRDADKKPATDENKPAADEKPVIHVITGTVRDEKGVPVAGASVVVANSKQGVSTNENGFFQLNVPDNADSLIITGIGYEDLHVSLRGQSTITATMTRQDRSANEVVVIGYGVQKKATLTGAVTTVSGKVLADLPVADLSSALAGRVPGLTVVGSATVPGSPPSISIRGLGTANDPSALFVIDGIVRDQSGMDGLDPNEVESVTVLKDAASAAVYGARAANGVILITTKRGSSQRPIVSYKASVGVESPTRTVKTMNAYENTQYNNDQLYVLDGYDQNAAQNDPRYFTPDEVAYYKTHSYNWMDELSKNGVLNQHNLSVNGGNQNIRYFMSAGYYDDNGNFNNLGYKRYTIRSNVDARISRDLTVSLTLDGNMKKSWRPWWDYDYNYAVDALPDLYHGIQNSSPFWPAIKDGKPVGNIANGDFVSFNASQIINNGGYVHNEPKSFDGIVALEYNVPFVKGLKLKGSYSYNYTGTFAKKTYRPYTLYDFATTGTNNHILTDSILGTNVVNQLAYSLIGEGQTDASSYQADVYLSYDRQFGEHHVAATAVYEQAEASTNVFNGQKQDLLTTAIDQLYIASSDPSLTSFGGSAAETGRLSYVGRVNYDYAGKYIFESAFRYDGSDIFPPGKRWGFFPSASVGWRISEEHFLKDNVNWLSNLKLRASLGLLGNDAVAPFQFQEAYSVITGPYFGNASTALYSSLYPNPNITWERTRSMNFGIDAGLLGNAITFTGDYFTRHTYDMLVAPQQTVPATFGYTLPNENYGIVDVHGWEASAGYNGRAGRYFTFNARVNVGYSKSKVTKTFVAQGTPSYLSPIGHPIHTITGYKSTGIIRNSDDMGKKLTLQGYPNALGMLSYADLYGANGGAPDGIVNANDQIILSDKADPLYNYGISLGGSWKNLSLDLFFEGLGGWDKSIYMSQGGIYQFWADHWSPSNPNAAFPRAYSSDPTNVASSFWIRDASFLRLKNLNLSYTLPRNLFNNTPVSSIRVFFTGTNLFLLFDKMKYMDPEAGGLGYYPIMKNFTGGINISF